MPVALAPTAVFQSSPQPMNVTTKSSSPEPVAFGTPTQLPVTTVLHERPARREVEHTESGEAFVARKDFAFKLESSLSAITLT